MGHSFTDLLFHVVCSTKHRRPLILSEARERLDKYIGGILRAENCSLLAAGGTADHTHWLIRCHPSHAVADVMRIVKSRSSGWARETLPNMHEFAWQGGYGAFSVSRSGVASVERYIADQAEHHRTMTFQEEFEALLRKHGVEFDPRYLWADHEA